MHVDVNFYEQLILAVVGAVLTVFVPWVSAAIVSHLKIASNSATATRVETGVNALAQLALGELSRQFAANPTIDVKNAALAQAMTRVSRSLQIAQKALGTSDETLKTRVAGQLAAMMNGPSSVTPQPIGLGSPN